ncbi:MAG: hypothetical protein RIN55_02285 [Tissierellaceae bacterium]|nr:hypothetical protein [Tissierellaceae bacterium]
MSSGLSFKRKFFILKREYSNMRNLNQKGHGKLEIRNNRLNLSINIDNVEGNTHYNVILLGDNKSYELGKIHTDNRHTGKAEFDLNYKDIESIGFHLEKISGILILRDSNVLLGGYLDKDDKSIENYISRLARIDIKEQKKEETQNKDEVEEIVEETETQTHEDIILEEDFSIVDLDVENLDVEEVIADDLSLEADEDSIPDVSTDEIIEEDELVVIEETKEIEEVEGKFIENDLFIPLDEPELEMDPSLVDTSNIDRMTEEEYGKVMQEMFYSTEELSQAESEFLSVDDQRKLNQKNQTTNYVLSILRFFPFIEPFKIDLMGYNWWRIDIDDPREDKGFLPYFSYVAGGNHKYPLVKNAVAATELIRKYGHYLFGLYNNNDEVKFYVYGVPGKFTTEDHPQKGTTGFNTWFESQDNMGYWLLYIDPVAGRIIYPINPMIPKD